MTWEEFTGEVLTISKVLWTRFISTDAGPTKEAEAEAVRMKQSVKKLAVVVDDSSS